MSIYLTDEHGKLHKVAGAGYGEIDNKLNKESTNPVQNKVIYNPVTFAESERQKTLNLFTTNNPNNYIHLLKSYIIGDNYIKVVRRSSYNNTRIQYRVLDINDYLGKTLYFKVKGYASGNNTGSISIRYMSENVEDVGDQIAGQNFNGSADIALTITLPTSISGNYHYLCILFYADTSTGVENDYVEYTDIMLSLQDIPYLSYNGPITHNGDAPVVFAESERQKSKNLWADGNVSGTLYKEVNLTNPIPAGTYTISFTVTTSDVDDPSSLINIVGKSGSAIGYFYLERNKRVSQSFTANEPIAKILFYAGGEYASSQGDTFSYTDIMITTDGSTDYQPYNGAVVHEKEVADVEHVEIIYDMSSSDSNVNLGKTTGIVSGDGPININLTKYKKLIVTYCFFSLGFIKYTIDLNSSMLIHNSDVNISQFMGGGTSYNQNNTSGSDSDHYFSNSAVNADKTSFNHILSGWFASGVIVPKNINYHSIITKIEGVY